MWEERDLTVPDLIVQLADRPVVLIGDGSEKVAPAGEVKGLRRIVPPLINRCSAGMVARIGSRKLERGETESTGALEPHYIKEFYTRAQ